MTEPSLGQIVILNGVPRSGKTSIAKVIQDTFPGVWMNLGVDGFKQLTPERYQPGIGLRPGGERPDLEPLVATLYSAMYESIAAHSRLGINVVVDVGHHDAYSAPLGILADCARRLSGLRAWFIGVRCPSEVILDRRRATWGVDASEEESMRMRVVRWDELVHSPGLYDFEVHTSLKTAEACAAAIRRFIESGTPPAALLRLARL